VVFYNTKVIVIIASDILIVAMDAETEIETEIVIIVLIAVKKKNGVTDILTSVKNGVKKGNVKAIATATLGSVINTSEYKLFPVNTHRAIHC
jgi:hypothetical protein